MGLLGEVDDSQGGYRFKWDWVKGLFAVVCFPHSRGGPKGPLLHVLSFFGKNFLGGVLYDWRRLLLRCRAPGSCIQRGQ